MIHKTVIATCLLLALATIVVGAISYRLTGNVSGVCPECGGRIEGLSPS